MTGSGTHSCRADLSDATAIEPALAGNHASFGEIDALVNNAGIYRMRIRHVKTAYAAWKDACSVPWQYKSYSALRDLSFFAAQSDG